MSKPIHLIQCAGRFCIAKIEPGSDCDEILNLQSYDGEFVSVTRTADEVSIICEQSTSNLQLLAGGACENDWLVFRVEGTLDFELVGIISRISGALANNKIPLFCLSTFETDYVLVKSHHERAAVNALRYHQINVTV